MTLKKNNWSYISFIQFRGYFGNLDCRYLILVHFIYFWTFDGLGKIEFRCDRSHFSSRIEMVTICTNVGNIFEFIGQCHSIVSKALSTDESEPIGRSIGKDVINNLLDDTSILWQDWLDCPVQRMPGIRREISWSAEGN